MIDESNGCEGIAEIYIKGRGRAVNGIGSSIARAWARLISASGLSIGEEFHDEG
jgi:hypothetical protein